MVTVAGLGSTMEFRFRSANTEDCSSCALVMGRRTVATLCPGPKAGVVVVFGLTSDRDGSTVSPIFRVSRSIVQCSGSAGVRAMNLDRVIKSNAVVFNIGTRTGGVWRRSTDSEPPKS